MAKLQCCSAPPVSDAVRCPALSKPRRSVSSATARWSCSTARRSAFPPVSAGGCSAHPDGYVTYGDDSTPPKGLLASLALARMEGRQPAIFLDDPDFPADPLVN